MWAPKPAVIIAYGDCSEPEREVFRRLVARNANNMNFEEYRVLFAGGGRGGGPGEQGGAGMGKIMILNGSPRAPRSNSKRYAQLFSQVCPMETAYFNITGTNQDQLCREMEEYSQVLFVFPLYADSIPVTLLNFLKTLEEHALQHKPTVSVLINCGFFGAGTERGGGGDHAAVLQPERIPLWLCSGNRERRGHSGYALPAAGALPAEKAGRGPW